MIVERFFARISPLFDVGNSATLGLDRRLWLGRWTGSPTTGDAGIAKFDLFDADVLEIENVIRHVCGLRYVGQRKVDALADVILDRNPPPRLSVTTSTLCRSRISTSSSRRRRGCTGDG